MYATHRARCASRTDLHHPGFGRHAGSAALVAAWLIQPAIADAAPPRLAPGTVDDTALRFRSAASPGGAGLVDATLLLTRPRDAMVWEPIAPSLAPTAAQA